MSCVWFRYRPFLYLANVLFRLKCCFFLNFVASLAFFVLFCSMFLCFAHQGRHSTKKQDKIKRAHTKHERWWAYKDTLTLNKVQELMEGVYTPNLQFPWVTLPSPFRMWKQWCEHMWMGHTGQISAFAITLGSPMTTLQTKPLSKVQGSLLFRKITLENVA